ncbi:carbon monoxide dehydrogenase [Geodermatophilus sp. DF01-2]|uniref:SRPBCC family protein n=1 Tax=Geodermatophilus sp. DF01-2 TaxID=2559610 RepID=UPI001072FBF0|nr:SRPBCC family protein [Geodermatophilus sp. DF01_2]TFV59843.1 carbon monoxide dehydrogenase [Geodermatophilus sp. DF01_2]
MQLNNEFVVTAPADQAWTLLTDLEKVAACLPGAALDGRDGDDYSGNVKIKVGPISAHFRGTARFVEKDDAAHSAVISAAGKDPRGQAAANATIRARLQPEGPASTRVIVDTELDISGRMAQFGRGAIADVSVRLMSQFADNLGAQIGADAGLAPAHTANGSPAPAASAPTPTAAPAPAYATPAPSSDAGLDALSLIGPVVVKRFGPGLAAVGVGVVLGWSLRGWRDRRRPWVQRLLNT